MQRQKALIQNVLKENSHWDQCIDLLKLVDQSFSWIAVVVDNTIQWRRWWLLSPNSEAQSCPQAGQATCFEVVLCRSFLSCLFLTRSPIRLFSNIWHPCETAILQEVRSRVKASHPITGMLHAFKEDLTASL